MITLCSAYYRSDQTINMVNKEIKSQSHSHSTRKLPPPKNVEYRRMFFKTKVSLLNKIDQPQKVLIDTES